LHGNVDLATGSWA